MGFPRKNERGKQVEHVGARGGGSAGKGWPAEVASTEGEGGLRTARPVGEPPKLHPPKSLGDDALAGESHTFTVARVVTRSAAYPSPLAASLSRPRNAKTKCKMQQKKGKEMPPQKTNGGGGWRAG